MKKGFILIHIEGKDELQSIYFHRVVPLNDVIKGIVEMLPNSEVEIKELPAGEPVIRKKRGRPKIKRNGNSN